MDKEDIEKASGSAPSDVEVRSNPKQFLHLGDIRTHKWHIIRCSAMTGLNLDAGLAWVVEDAKARLFLY